MKITLTTGGSRGDVQPYVALSLGLRQVGHEVTIAAPTAFVGLVRERGLHFRPLTLDPHQIVSDQLKGGRANPFEFALRSRRALAPYAQQLLEDTLAACEGAEAVVYTAVGYLGREVARHRGLPCAGAMYGPLLTKTDHFPSSFAPIRGSSLPVPPRSEIGRFYNRLSYPLSQQLLWQFLRRPVDQCLRRAGMRPLGLRGPFNSLAGSEDLIVHGWSRVVLPAPPSWGSLRPVTGYWFLDSPDEWQPTRDLSRFLNTGPPPVSVGFGSMDTAGDRKLWALVLRALQLSKRRGILLTAHEIPRAHGLRADVMQIVEAPHDRLFSKCSIAIHHGGAGTTGASVRAGIPSVTVPHFADQFFWGARISALGIGPPPLPQRTLTPGRLAAAILAADVPAVRQRAAVLGEGVRGENGIRHASEALDRYLRARS